MRSSSRGESEACGIMCAAAVVGDRWSLLILKQIIGGNTRFEGLVHALGASCKVLSGRLRNLTEHRILVRRQYDEPPPRFAYVLTGQGQGLAPVLTALQGWADRWLPAEEDAPSIATLSGATEGPARGGAVGSRGAETRSLRFVPTCDAVADPLLAEQQAADESVAPCSGVSLSGAA
ncbi:winged helix-turn-helix transcriptional regulator [Streptomyces sp. NPDC002104]